jgi:hypothetical protein
LKIIEEFYDSGNEGEDGVDVEKLPFFNVIMDKIKEQNVKEKTPIMKSEPHIKSYGMRH